MLSKEDNELLCRVGPGTPMGELFRSYWLPAIRSIDLPEPDGPPARVRLLGEDLVAFRDTNGRVGLLTERCSHRRASLFYGRNEECGLRCIYHGWKFDADGNILDTPAEPAESMIKHHVKHQAYSCREVNGMVYAYLGPAQKMPLLPALPWLTLPNDHVHVGGRIINECNWLQTQEGNIDSTHTPFLHSRAGGLAGQPFRNRNNPPTFDADITRWGVRAVIRYPAEGGAAFTRTNTFVMPVYTALPNGESVDGKLDGFTVNVEAPMDDDHTMRYTIQVQRTLPAGVGGRFGGRGFPLNEVAPDGRKLINLRNDYLIDRAKQRTDEPFSGLDASFAIQDGCMVESMGPVVDRTQEHLGVGDTQIAAVRKFLLDAVRDSQAGGHPPGVAWDVEDNDFSDLYLLSAIVPAGQDWMAMLPDLTTHILAGMP